MFYADAAVSSNSPYDHTAPEPIEEMSIQLGFTTDIWSLNGTLHVYDLAGQMYINQYRLKLGGGWPSLPPNMYEIENYYLSHNDLASFVNSPSYHNNIVVTYDDGIQSIPYSAPIIIRSGNLNPDPITQDNIPDAGFHFYRDTIFTPTVWTPTNNDATNKLHLYRADTLRIEDSLYIMPGASLTIHGMTVEFGPKGLVYVDKGNASTSTPGAYLELDSTTFTWYHNCSNSNGSADMWAGVIVSGNQDKYQGSGYQGKMVTKYSQIEYAKVGVSVGDIGLYDISGTGTGGILQANKTVFNNNTLSVYVLPFHNINPTTHTEEPNQMKFNDCDFENDHYLPTTFKYFIYGADVTGVQVHGCRFTNGSSSLPTGYGIQGFDMGLWVDNSVQFPSLVPALHRSSFKNLLYGVDLKAIKGTRTITARYSRFDQNDIGMMLEGIQVPSSTSDTFIIPTFDPNNAATMFLALTTVGYAQMTGSGYTVHDDRFEKATPITGDYGIGAFFSNTGSSPNQANKNNYIDMRFGNLSNYKNRGFDINNKPTGLEFKCNSHSGGTFDEAAEGTNSIIHGIRAKQGEATLSAGNTFSGSGTNIDNASGQVGSIVYYYHGTIPTSQGSVNKVTADSNNCQTINDDHTTGPFGLAVRGYNSQSHLKHPVLNDSTMDYPPSGTSLISRAQVYANINYYLNDSAGMPARDSLYYWTTQAQTAYTDLLLTDLVLRDSSDSAGLYNALYYIYDSIPHWYGLDSVERIEFRQGRKLEQLKIKLQLGGRGIMQLDEDEQNILQAVADSSNAWARVRAQNWLSLYNDSMYDYTVLLPVDSSDTSGAKPAQASNEITGNVGNVTADSDRLYPNPVHELLYVSYTGGAGIISISDLSGRVVLRKALKGGGSTEALSLKGLAPGMYLYHISEGGKTRMQGKIAKD